MKPIYLVQLGQKRKEPLEAKEGIDALISWEYMGSAEFEWGALPNSLKRFRASAKSFEAKATGLKATDGRSLMLLCRPEDRSEIEEFLKGNSKTRDHKRWFLKERLELAESLAPEAEANKWRLYDVWWDVENDWMAVLGEKLAEKVFKRALSKKE
jgi:hypothetical protein